MYLNVIQVSMGKAGYLYISRRFPGVRRGLGVRGISVSLFLHEARGGALVEVLANKKIPAQLFSIIFHNDEP